MLRVAIVEDEKACADELRGYIEKYGQEHGLDCRVHTFRDGSEILRLYQAQTPCPDPFIPKEKTFAAGSEPDGASAAGSVSGIADRFDIILLDIEMPNVNGMEAAQKIRKADAEVVLMFITNMAQYAIQGYSVGALDFVMKPVTWYTFQLKFTRAIERAGQRRDAQLLLNSHDGAVRLGVRSIFYVEIQNRVLHYHTESGEFEVRGTLQSAEEQLAPFHFAKCNHWYIVNLAHVQQVKKNIVVVAGTELEISRRARTAFLEELTKYMGG